MKRLLCALLALFTVFTALTGCGNKIIENPEDVSGKRIAVLENSSSVVYAQMYGSEVRICSDKKELVNAIKLGDVDCALVDEQDKGYVTRFQFGVRTIKEPFMEAELRIATAKENPDLIKDVNRAISYLEEEDIIDDIISGYRSGEGFVFEPTAVPEDAKTLTVAVCVQSGIFCYYDENGEIRGIDVDIARAVCAYLGLNCEFEVMDTDELIPAVWGGTAHFAIGCITENSHNADMCIMSDPYTVCTQMIIID